VQVITKDQQDLNRIKGGLVTRIYAYVVALVHPWFIGQ
jgi:hypothetical protein